jgi:hypothetical protein
MGLLIILILQVISTLSLDIDFKNYHIQQNQTHTPDYPIYNVKDKLQYPQSNFGYLRDQVININDLLKIDGIAFVYNSIIYYDYDGTVNSESLFLKVYNSSFVVSESNAYTILHNNPYNKLKFYLKSILENRRTYDIEFKSVVIK